MKSSLFWEICQIQPRFLKDPIIFSSYLTFPWHFPSLFIIPFFVSCSKKFSHCSRIMPVPLLPFVCVPWIFPVYLFPLSVILLYLPLIYWGKVIHLFFAVPVKRWCNITVTQSGSLIIFIFWSSAETSLISLIQHILLLV